MFNTSVTVAHVVFTVSLVTGCLQGCSINGKPMFASTTPSSATPVETTTATAPAPTPTPAVMMTPHATPASSPAQATPAAEPDLEKFKFNLIRAEAGLNEATSKICIDSYNELIASGVAPSYRMRFRDEESTLESLKQKYCVDAAASAAKSEEQRTAPYRAKLKSDKLKMAIKSHYAIAGGDYSMDPAKLAAAPVWFDSVGAPSNEKQNCDNGGKRNIVRRYQFDTSHALTKTTEREYCGSIPAAAYR